MSALKDEQIIEAILKGNTAVIKEFYRKNLRSITSYVLKNSGNQEDAEDVFQDAMVLVYQKLKTGNFELQSKLSTYIYAVSKNIWLNKLRKDKKWNYENEFSEDISALDTDILDQILQNERVSLFRKHFFKLSDSCRKILGFFFEGHSMRDIAAKTGFTEGYTRKKKFECKTHLLLMIEKDPEYLEIKTISKDK